MGLGLSFVICTRNGASKLRPTLEHLAAQRFRDGTSREILLVDNASSDNTCEVARRRLAPDPALPLRIVHEPTPGTGHARRRGLREARHDYVTFVDDDNWLVPDFGQIAFDRMEADPRIALVCARSEAVFGGPKPPWFDARQRAFAVGPQFALEGDVTDEIADWWTAGLTIRKVAWEDLLENGFRPRVHGRDGRHLGAGEDTEMCLAILLAGWRAYYDARLLYRHWIPAERLTWRYACRLSYQGQKPLPPLLAYRFVLAERRGVGSAAAQPSRWTTMLARIGARAARRAPTFARDVLGGKPLLQATVLQLLTSLGTLSATLAYRSRYDALLAELRVASWVGGGPDRVARVSTPSSWALHSREAW
jgi:glycosyltransferase involved in cell wall biosynthesis